MFLKTFPISPSSDLRQLRLLPGVCLDDLVPGEPATSLPRLHSGLLLPLLLLGVTERLGGETLLHPTWLKVLAERHVVGWWLEVLLGQVVVRERRDVLDGVRVQQAQGGVSSLVPTRSLEGGRILK